MVNLAPVPRSIDFTSLRWWLRRWRRRVRRAMRDVHAVRRTDHFAEAISNYR